MKKDLIRVAATIATVGVVVAGASNVVFAHHARRTITTIQYASCYQNSSCTGYGSCDVNGVCQNGGVCIGGYCYTDGSCDVDGICQNGGNCNGIVHNTGIQTGNGVNHHTETGHHSHH